MAYALRQWGTDYAQPKYDFYGILQDIVELEYLGVPVKNVMLFKCDWFDPTLNRGTKENWLSVITIKTRSIIDTPASKAIVGPFQVDELEVILLVIVHEDKVTLPILDTPASEIRYEYVDMPVDKMEYEDDEDQEEDEDEDDGEEDTDDEVDDIYEDEDKDDNK
ncbi:hypothetical protein K1719_021119 [Acacia pycnantha]|nr:hypothetical protein K1719_021119 [Acacia pycnantha]